MAEALIKYETIDADQIKEIMSGNPPSPPADWDSMTTSTKPKKKASTDLPKAASNDSMTDSSSL